MPTTNCGRGKDQVVHQSSQCWCVHTSTVIFELLYPPSFLLLLIFPWKQNYCTGCFRLKCIPLVCVCSGGGQNFEWMNHQLNSCLRPQLNNTKDCLLHMHSSGEGAKFALASQWRSDWYGFMEDPTTRSCTICVCAVEGGRILSESSTQLLSPPPTKDCLLYMHQERVRTGD